MNVTTLIAPPIIHYSDLVSDIGSEDLTVWESIPNTDNPFDVYKDVPIVMRCIIHVINDFKTTHPFSTTLSVNDLNSQQRHILYKHLSEFNITWWKNNDTKSICININNIWKIPQRNSNYPIFIRNIQTNIDLYNGFYDRVQYQTSAFLTGWLIVSSNNFIRYRRMISICIERYNNSFRFVNHNNTNNILISNIIPFSNNSKNTHKMELSNLIFDIKEKLTDSEYKTIMDTLANIS